MKTWLEIILTSLIKNKKWRYRTLNKSIKKFLFFALLFFSYFLFMEGAFYYLINIEITLTSILYNSFYGIFFVVLIMMIKRNNTSYFVTLVIMIFITLLYFSQLLHYTAFQSFWRFYHLVRLKELFAVRDSIFLFFHYKDILLILPILLFGIFGIFYFRDIKQKDEIISKVFLKRTLSLLIVIGLVVTYLQITYLNDDLTRKELINSYEYQKKYGMLDYFFSDFVSTIPRMGDKLKIEDTIKNEMQNTFSLKLENNEWTNIYKGKNLIFITAESLAPFAIDPDLTPNLYRMRESGIYFDNYYSPNTNTFASEFAILKSFPFSNSIETKQFSGVNTLPTIFKNAGYSAKAFHNNTQSFYDRKNRMVDMGFESFYGAEDLLIPIDSRIANMGGDHPADAELFEKSFDYTNFDGKPFVNYYMTITGHGVYSQDLRPSLSNYVKQVEEKYPELNEDSMGYLASQMKFDYGVGVLLKKLEVEKVLEDTVIVIVGDHYPYMLGKSNISDYFYVEENLDLYKTPFIIWDSKSSKKVVEKPIANVDVLPTLANLFGLKLDYSFGMDSFSKENKEIDVEWFDNRNYSFITNSVKVDRLNNEYYDEIREDNFERIVARSYRRKELSDMFLLLDDK